MKQELSVKRIWESLSDFWDLFEDKEVISQLWRGYYLAIQNLRYQLYQVALSKSLFNIRENWISDWEHFTFDASTAITVDNIDYPYYPDYPHRFVLPRGVKNVLTLRESPREVSHLPNDTVCVPSGLLVTPDGNVRYMGEDAIYEPEKIIIWDDSYIFPKGINVDTKILSEDNGDYKVDEATRSIHFKELPYREMWSHMSIRDLTSVYSNFGCLIGYPGVDSKSYLRKIQGLWYSYWMGATIADIERGITILNELPFAQDDGIVESVEVTPAKMKIGDFEFEPSLGILDSIHLGDTISSIDYATGSVIFLAKGTAIDIPMPYNTTRLYLREEKNSDNVSISLQQALDDGLIAPGFIVRTPDHEFRLFENADQFIYWEIASELHPHQHYILYRSESDESLKPASGATLSYYSLEQQTLKLGKYASTKLSVDIVANLHVGDVVEAITERQTRIIVDGEEQLISGYAPISVTAGQAIPKFACLTECVKVYDYINSEALNAQYIEPVGVRLDTDWYLDSGIILDLNCTVDSAESLYKKYFNFIVSIDATAFSTTEESLRLLKAFIDTVKPAYTNYTFEFSLNFQDNVICYDDGMSYEWVEEPYDRPYTDWVLDDESGVCLDDGYYLDAGSIDSDFDLSLTYEDTMFYDIVPNTGILDDEAGLYLDTGWYLDTAPYDDTLELEWSQEDSDMLREKTLIKGETFKIEVTLYNEGEPAVYPVEDMYSDALFSNGLRVTLQIAEGGMPGKYILTGDFDTWNLPGDDFQVNIGVYDSRGSDKQIVASFNDTFYIADSATDLSNIGERS